MRIIQSFADRPTPIRVVQGQMRQRQRTCVDVLEQCLGRIAELEPQVQAWVLVDRDGAMAQARALDDELRAGQCRGPLHGIPVGIKDIVDVTGFPTLAGSSLLQGNMASRDATIVERLRDAGAVILGKTVTTQFASFDPPTTRNPWDLDRTPGGSSSGSAAAVACGMCLAAIGSQTGGSITRPASYCGVAGCKPTFGHVSTAGVLGLAPSMDHPGPIARCVYDLAVLLEAIAGPDPRDPRGAHQPAPRISETLAGHEGRAIRLGLVQDIFHELAEPAMRQAIANVVHKLRSFGVPVRDLALPSSFANVLRSHRVIMAAEGATCHRERFAIHASDYLPRIRGLIEEGLRATAVEYIEAREHQQQLRRDMLQCFDSVDALLTPATLGTAPDCSTTGDPAFNSPWSFTGQPTVSFPVALSQDGLPLAIQLVGRPFGEAELFGTAAFCERLLSDEAK